MKHQNQHQNPHRRPTPQLLACALASCLAMAAPVAQAQTTTASIRGLVTANSAPVASAQIVATNLANGSARRTEVGADGRYVLVGLQPGTYRIDTIVAGQTVSSQNVTVQIGQSATLDIPTGVVSESAANATTLDTITVVGRQLIETKTSEVATNVTRQQIEALPQSSRNFLNFAGLAPGITINENPDGTSKSFSAAGQPANQTNVFIDGANLKNNILQGGLVGQDSSKGNPFSQEAIQEFRVLTQNYKAEYEQAGTATITAITKSGTNEFHGSVYGFLQTKGMREQEYFSEKRGEDKADYRREQYGATFGGPIVKDKLFFFLNYEAYDEDGNQSVAINPLFPQFAQYSGTFQRPFHEKVFFGKLRWFASDDDTIDLSLSRRRDDESIGFGGTTAFDARQQRKNDVDDVLLKWQHSGDGWLNEALLDSGKYAWNPQPANPGLLAQDFESVARIGGASGTQDKRQKSLTLRDDVTFTDLDWHGKHVIKTGVKFANYDLNLVENNTSNPLYHYSLGQPGLFDTPYRVEYSPTGKVADISNRQIGVYIQDDWDVTSRLQLNLGLRWDYESNANNKDYVTPADQASYIRYLIDQPGTRNISEDFIADGHSRKPETDMIQPRLGFSYDFSHDNDQSWVVFGGAGRYYDRTPLDNSIQESFHAQYPYYQFFFSPDGSNGTIQWDPIYLTADGLNSLITSGNAGNGELDLLNNNTRAPYSDQFSLGVKHAMGDWVASVTLSRVLGYRQFTWIWANRLPIPNSFLLVTQPGVPYGAVLTNTEKNYTSKGLFLTLDKAYTDESGWGLGVAYTYQDAKKQGGDAYSLDYTRPSLYPDNHVGEKNHLVINGIMRLPWDFRLSGLITLGSGAPFNANQTFDFLDESGPNEGIHLGAAYPKKYSFIIPNAWAYRSVDLSLSKDFKFGDSQAVQLRLDGFNVFNFKNFACYNDFAPANNFGNPNCTTGSPRAYQVSARYSF
jgi:hypothetical protein